jgi:hypothetical protein
LRLPRLIQSPLRSSSSIAPRMRWVAKVSNITPCAAVEAARGVVQADHAGLDHVVEFDVGRQLGDHLVREPSQPGG